MDDLAADPADGAASGRFRQLLGIAARLATIYGRRELLDTIASATLELLGADEATIRLRVGDELRVVATSGIDDETARSLPLLTVDDPHIAPRLAAGHVVAAVDMLASADAEWLRRYEGSLVIRGALFVPLVEGDRPIGFLSATTREAREWSPDDLELAAGLGAHAALAIRNALLFERLDARANHLAVVQAASARINSARTVEAVGRAIVEEVAAMVDYHNARVYLLEPPDDLMPVAFEGRVGVYETVDPELLRVKMGEGFTGWVALHGESLLIPDANADERGAQIPGTDAVPESMLVVPVSHDGGVVGVITLSKLGLDQFSEDDRQVLSIVADQAATALASARLLTRSETLAWELRRLLDMSSELSQSLDPRLIGAILARHVSLALGVDGCVISSWDTTGDRIVSLGGYPDDVVVGYRPEYALAEFPETRRVLERLATVLIDADDPEADPAEVAVLREGGHRTLAMIPLVAKGRAVGLVELMATGVVRFDEGRLGLARTMANEAAMALENARLYEAARSLADRDPLTSFYNHRYLHERLGEEVVRARRSRSPLSLLMIDLDDFKLVNDTFGHQFGDRFLVRLADIVRSTLRAPDIAARYGGDEFAAILPDTDAAAAARAAHRLIDALSASPVTPEGRGPVPVSVSIGVAALGVGLRTATDLIDAADQAMYAAKARGGNRVAVSPGSQGPEPEPRVGSRNGEPLASAPAGNRTAA